MTVIAVLGVIGIMQRLIRRDYLLPLWVVVPFLFAGRSATNLVIIPLAMLAAVGLVEVILPALQVSVKGDAEQSSRVTAVERNFLIYMMLFMVFSAYQFGFQLTGAALPISDREAMDWVRQNTPNDSRFLVLSGATSVACDSVAEWFPMLAERQSLYTIQGTEWTKADGFKPFIREAVDLQLCSRETPDCVESLVTSGYEYVYFSKKLRSENCDPLPFAMDFPRFVGGVHEDERYEIIYETDEVMIYRRNDSF